MAQAEAAVNNIVKDVSSGVTQVVTGIKHIVEGQVQQGAGEILTGGVQTTLGPVRDVVDGLTGTDRSGSTSTSGIIGSILNKQLLDKKKSVYAQIMAAGSSIDSVTRNELFQQMGGDSASGNDITNFSMDSLSAIEAILAEAKAGVTPKFSSRMAIQKRYDMINASPTSKNILTDRNPLMQGGDPTLTGVQK